MSTDGFSTLEAVATALDKVAKKQRTDPTESKIDDMLGLLTGWLGSGADSDGDEEVVDETDCEAAGSESFAALVEEVESVGGKDAVKEHLKELGLLVTKLGKAVDKTVSGDLDQALPGAQLDRRLIDEAVATHLLAEGHFEVAEAFICDASAPQRTASDGCREEGLGWLYKHAERPRVTRRARAPRPPHPSRDSAAGGPRPADLGDSRCVALAAPLKELQAVLASLRAHEAGPALSWAEVRQARLRALPSTLLPI